MSPSIEWVVAVIVGVVVIVTVIVCLCFLVLVLVAVVHSRAHTHTHTHAHTLCIHMCTCMHADQLLLTSFCEHVVARRGVACSIHDT